MAPVSEEWPITSTIGLGTIIKHNREVSIIIIILSFIKFIREIQLLAVYKIRIHQIKKPIKTHVSMNDTEFVEVGCYRIWIGFIC